MWKFNLQLIRLRGKQKILLLFKSKNYVKDKGITEGSIAEEYIVEECLTICSHYLIVVEMQDAHLLQDTVGMIIHQTVGRLLYKGIVVWMNHDEFDKTH